MKLTLSSRLFVAVLLSFALIALELTRRPVLAQNEALCYAVADHADPSSADALVTLDRVSAVTTVIGMTGTDDIEAIAMEPGSGPLYAADGDQLGTLDLSTGAFTAKPSPFGTGSGALGAVEFDDVDGLTVDPLSGVLYGTQRRSSPELDVLLQIDKASGAHVPDAFGPGVDYVVIQGPGVLNDIDDIAVDPTTGQMFAASNIGGEGGVLVSVNKTSGAAEVVGQFGVGDIEGLAYFNDGQLYGSTGHFAGDPDTRNQLYQIDESTGQATLVAPFSQFHDYEALDCLTGPTAIALSSINAASVSGPAFLTVTLVTALSALAIVTVFVLWRGWWGVSRN